MLPSRFVSCCSRKSRNDEELTRSLLRSQGKEFEFQRPFGSYVMENILFKISFPAEFHAQVRPGLVFFASTKDDG